MILYCAANKKYFDLYFDLWQKQANRFYPDTRKIIALYQGTPKDFQKAQSKGVEVKDVTHDRRFPNNPIINHFYVLRWLHLPYEYGENILETQVNCLAVKKAMTIDKDNWGAEHARISRWKYKDGKKYKGGVSAAIFTPNAALKVVKQAEQMIVKPPESDHPMNLWQEQNLTWEPVVAEQQFKHLNQRIEDYTCWVTAGTSQHYTPEQKLEVLNHYVGA
jgi:hypothetical protein